MIAKKCETKCKGRLEVVCGSMFSGKSEELIRRLRRAEFANLSTQVFKHSLDDRTTTEYISAHSGDRLAAVALENVHSIREFILPETDVVGIDEVQFFSHDIVVLVNDLIEDGKRVIVAGLDLDFRGIPFGPMPTLLAMADDVLKLKAVCMKSGQDAHFTQRLVDGRPARVDEPIVLIGAKEWYEARSRDNYAMNRDCLIGYVNQQKQLMDD